MNSAIGAFLPIGSDLYLPLRTIGEHHDTLVSVIWAFCQLVLTSATTGDASVGEVFVCESVSVSLGEGL